MPYAHRFYSSRKATLLMMVSLFGLAGCSSDNPLELRQSLITPPHAEMQAVVPPELALNRPAKVSSLPLKPTIEPAADEQVVTAASETERVRTSSWCAQLRESSAADATVLRSPTLSGSLDNKGKVAINLGVSASSFYKASLMEQAAEARCRKYLAETGLQVLVFVSPQNLTAAGYRAKSDTILKQSQQIASLRKSISRAMQAGEIDREKATSIFVLLDRLMAEGKAAKSQADRRISERLLDGKSVDHLSRALLLAENDIDNINSKLTTAAAVDVSAKVGWGDPDISNENSIDDQSFNGKVSFSIQLGALNPSRFEHERLASEAKQRAISSEEGGAIWQIGVLRRAHERAIAGLEESKVKLDSALSEVNHLLAVLNSEKSPEFEGARLNARLEILKLRADQAGVSGSLAEIRANLVRLKKG